MYNTLSASWDVLHITNFWSSSVIAFDPRFRDHPHYWHPPRTSAAQRKAHLNLNETIRTAFVLPTLPPTLGEGCSGIRSLFAERIGRQGKSRVALLFSSSSSYSHLRRLTCASYTDLTLFFSNAIKRSGFIMLCSLYVAVSPVAGHWWSGGWHGIRTVVLWLRKKLIIEHMDVDRNVPIILFIMFWGSGWTRF